MAALAGLAVSAPTPPVGRVGKTLCQNTQGHTTHFAQRAIDQLIGDIPPRSLAQWQALVARGTPFSLLAQQFMADAHALAAHHAALRARLTTLAAHYPAAVADIRGQLARLLAVNYVLATPPAQWARLPVYLKAIDIRLTRLPNKPQRDSELMAILQRHSAAAQHDPWGIEEWRVQQFAQELKAVGAAKL